MTRWLWAILAALVIVALGWRFWPGGEQTAVAPPAPVPAAQAPSPPPAAQPPAASAAGQAPAPAGQSPAASTAGQAPAPAAASTAEQAQAPAPAAQPPAASTAGQAPAPVAQPSAASTAEQAPAAAAQSPAASTAEQAPAAAAQPPPASTAGQATAPAAQPPAAASTAEQTPASAAQPPAASTPEQAPAAAPASPASVASAGEARDAEAAAIDKATNELASLKPGFVPKDLITALNDSVVNFPTGSAEVPASISRFLESAASDLKQLPKGNVLEIAGYTDNTGDAAINLQLSQRRADAVRDALIKAGADPEMLVAKGYGSADPIASNDTPEGRERNRRIEYHVVKEP